MLVNATGLPRSYLVTGLGRIGTDLVYLPPNLAGETWDDVVLEVVEAERARRKIDGTIRHRGQNVLLQGLLTTQVAGVTLPEYIDD